MNGVNNLAYKFTGLAASITKVVMDVNTAIHTHNFGPVLNDFLGGNDHINGSPFADHLVGLGGNDTITGGASNDTMAGGAGQDTFVFRNGFGHDVITDALPTPAHDIIIMHSVPGAHLGIVGGNVVISDSAGDTLTFTHVHTLPQFHAHYDLHLVA